MTGNARDRDGTGAGGGPRLAGIVFSTDTSVYFRFDLDATGNYDIHCACGDASSPQEADWDFKDNTTTKFSTSGSIAGGSFKDATNTTYTGANWPGSETAATATFSSTQLRAYTAGSSGNRVIAHLRAATSSVPAATATVWLLVA